MASLGLSQADRESIERFEAEVIEPSMSGLVLLDFWAEWCAPCKQLGPIMDKIAEDYSTKGVSLTKIDVDKDKTLAAQFRIQSIPTVYAIHRGQPVADLSGFRTEGQLTKAIDQLLAQLKIAPPGAVPQAEIEPLIAMGEQVLAEGDATRAVSIFRQVKEMAPDDPGTIGGLVRALIAAGELDEARTIIDGLAPEVAKNSDVSRARAALDLAVATPAAGDVSNVEADAAADPDNIDAQFALAQARLAAGNRDSAADILLNIIARDREWNDGAARTRFLQMLEAQGLEDPWSSAQRRRLSALLFT